MKEVKEINKNRRAKFTRLLSEFANGRVGASAILAQSFINKDLFNLAEQYLVYVKRDFMSCETQADILTRLDSHVQTLLDFNANYSHVVKCLNSIHKGRFKPELAQKKEEYFGHKIEINFTELGYIVYFPDDEIKLFCEGKCVNDIQFNL